MDSLAAVGLVMVSEEVFGMDILAEAAEPLRSPRAMVNWLERRLSERSLQRPSRGSA
jgi:acyl carrier protein